jgi:hypothetical protein
MVSLILAFPDLVSVEKKVSGGDTPLQLELPAGDAFVPPADNNSFDPGQLKFSGDEPAKK